ncbi:MAG: hypothetical protein WCH46_06330 [bacterium]
MKYFFVAFVFVFLCLTSVKSIASTDSLRIAKKRMSITEVLEKNTPAWMKHPGVVGTGEGRHEGKPCIIIMMNGHQAEIKKIIPKQISGFQVIFEETGKISPRK